VKAQDIQVFNTEHLSPLFERVIVASGTSNRQTKALAASVRDSVREAGFPKPRTEGEENGEWIIVDCGAAVAHIMQPAIRQYYHLEEIWGDKPVRLKFGAPKPAEASAPEPKAPAKKAGKKVADAEMTSLRRSSAAKTAVKAAEREAKEEKARTTPARKGAPRTTVGRTRAQPAGKAAGKTAARPASRAGSSKPTLKVVGKPAAKKAPAKKAASKAPGRGR
jgi:ribosome-associated protein